MAKKDFYEEKMTEAKELEVEEIKEPVEKWGKVISPTGVNVRKTASFKAEIVMVLAENDRILITGETGKFYQTKSGFVAKEFVEIM